MSMPSDVTPGRLSSSAPVDAALALLDVSAGYSGRDVVHDLQLTVREGEIVGLFGANGAGKSTTLAAVAGLLEPSCGQVLIGGRRAPRSLVARARRGLGYLPEQRSIFPRLTTRQNLVLGRGSLDEALRVAPELEARLEQQARTLSGGEQQLLCVARLCAGRPRVLALDELSLGLAPRVVERIFDVLRTMAARGTAILCVEQHVRQALTLVDRGYVMRRGEIVLEGDAEALDAAFSRPDDPYFTRGR